MTAFFVLKVLNVFIKYVQICVVDS